MSSYPSILIEIKIECVTSVIDLKKQLEELESLSKKTDQEKKILQDNHMREVTSKDIVIKSFDMQTDKLQTSLDLSVKSNDQLKTELKSKETDLSNRKVELEKIGVRYESLSNELKMLKDELKRANKVALDAQKQVAKLEGKLDVYTLFDNPEKGNKQA